MILALTIACRDLGAHNASPAARPRLSQRPANPTIHPTLQIGLRSGKTTR